MDEQSLDFLEARVRQRGGRCTTRLKRTFPDRTSSPSLKSHYGYCGNWFRSID